MKPRRGVTLIELVVVMAIIGIVAGVAVPAFARLGAASTSPADQVANVLRSARMRAIESGMPVTVTFDPAHARYWLSSGAPLGMTLEGATLVGDVRIDFRFLPSGAANADALAIREGDVTRVIMVDRWSGEVRVGAR